MTNDQIRFQFGELNASEMRLARAIVGWHEREQAKLRAAAEAMATSISSILCPGFPEGCNKPTEFEDRMLRSALAAYQATKKP